MPKPGTYSVANWDDYQHYKTGDRAKSKAPPPWIKLYTSLLSDFEFCQLPNDGQAFYQQILLLAAMTGNQIAADPKWISRQLALDLTDDRCGQLCNLLLDSGFLMLAGGASTTSKPMLAGGASTIREEKKRKEKSRAEEIRGEKTRASESQSGAVEHPAPISSDSMKKELWGPSGWDRETRSAIAQAGNELADAFRISRGAVQVWWNREQQRKRHGSAVLDSIQAAIRHGPEKINDPLAWMSRASPAKSQDANARDAGKQAGQQRADNAAAAEAFFGSSGRQR